MFRIPTVIGNPAYPGDRNDLCMCRLTLTSGTPVTASDVTAAANVYVTPYKGNSVSLYMGGKWRIFTFSQITISLASKAADTNYDIFLYTDGVSVLAELVAWSTATARATALVFQDGVYCKSGDLNKRYIGTIRTTATIGQCEDSVTKRFVWNYYNRINRRLYRYTYNSHTYSTNSWRVWNGEAASSHRLEVVIGLTEEALFMNLVSELKGDADGRLMALGIGRDSTSAVYTNLSVRNGNLQLVFAGQASPIMETLGYHYYVVLETAFSGLQGTFNMYEINGIMFG